MEKENRGGNLMKLDWTNAEWASGTKLTEWCKENNITPLQSDQYSKWCHGRDPRIDTVDKLMCHNDRHIFELPDDIWIKGPRAASKSKA
jgi:hypothetical protein